MPDPTNVIALVVAGILGGVGLWWSRRELRRAGIADTRAEAIANLQIVADTWEERYNLEHEARVTADKATSDVRAERDALLRIVERRRAPRQP